MYMFFYFFQSQMGLSLSNAERTPSIIYKGKEKEKKTHKFSSSDCPAIRDKAQIFVKYMSQSFH